MTEPDYPPQPAEDPGHVLSEEDWDQVLKLREQIVEELEQEERAASR